MSPRRRSRNESSHALAETSSQVKIWRFLLPLALVKGLAGFNGRDDWIWNIPRL